MRQVKFDDLEAGTLTKTALIVRIFRAGEDGIFFGDEPGIRFFEINDCYYGQALRTVKPDEIFEVEHEIGSPEYVEIIQKLVAHRAAALKQAENDIDLLCAFSKAKK